jgi:DNA-binding NarL/FixJ family response regulator
MITECKSKIKILIADDHPLFRQGLKNAFAETPDIEVVGEAENGNDVLEKVRECDLNLVLLDISMPGKGGLEVLKQLKSEHLEAVRKVAQGGNYASADITEKLAFDFLNIDKPLHELLSDREYQVFSMISTGKSLTEIGNDLSLSVKTISTHRTRILEKMRMKKNAELIHYAIQHELI